MIGCGVEKIKMPVADWIKKNMFGTYSEELGRSLTDAEVRFQRCLEQLSVPSWYRTYSKPPTLRKNKTPIECRTPSWKKMKIKSGNTPRKTPKKRSEKFTPKGDKIASSRTSRPDSGFNETYRISRKTPIRNKIPFISSSSSESNSPLSSPKHTRASHNSNSTLIITSSSSDAEYDTPRVKNKRNVVHSSKIGQTDRNDTFEIKTPSPKKTRESINEELLNLSKLPVTPISPGNTFPRVTPSRKIQNINIVFDKPFPPQESTTPGANDNLASKTVYIKTKNIELHQCDDESTIVDDDFSRVGRESNHASFFIADVEPLGVTTRIKVFAGLDSDEFDYPEASSKCSPSPNTRFFNSKKKSTELEKIVQKTRTCNGNRSLIQEIIDELERSIADSTRSRISNPSYFEDGSSFAKYTTHTLKRIEDTEAEDDGRSEASSDASSDSELAKSISISFKSYDSETEEPTTPLPRLSSSTSLEESEKETKTIKDKVEEDISGDEEVHWISNKICFLQRTSSHLSTMSRSSSVSTFGFISGVNSPGLSPIKHDKRESCFQQPEQQNKKKNTKGWGLTYSTRRNSNKNSASRQPFRIEETAAALLDSGYSDRSSGKNGRSSSSTRTVSSANSAVRSSPNSLASTPTLINSETVIASNSRCSFSSKSGPYVMKSFLV